MKHGIMVALAWAAIGCRGPRVPSETASLQSTALREAAYDHETHTLSLAFPNGAVYAYAAVPPGHFDGLRTSERPGTYFHEHIRNRYAATRVR